MPGKQICQERSCNGLRELGNVLQQHRGSPCPGDELPSKLAGTMNQGICWCWETRVCGTQMQFV